MILTPITAFIFGLIMGAAGMLILLMTIGASAKLKEKKEKKPALNDDLIKDLFKEYIKETKK